MPEHVKLYGIDLDASGRCIHYHTRQDVAMLLCSRCRKYYACYQCHDALEDHTFVAKQSLIHGAVCIRTFILSMGIPAKTTRNSKALSPRRVQAK